MGGLAYLDYIRDLAGRLEADWEGVKADLERIRCAFFLCVCQLIAGRVRWCVWVSVGGGVGGGEGWPGAHEVGMQ